MNCSSTLDDPHLCPPETPTSVYTTEYVLPEESSVVAIPLEPRSLRLGSYQIHIGEVGEKPDQILEFSVWNTQAEIDALRELGDKRGALISNIMICKTPVSNNCEESFSQFSHGIKAFHVTLKIDDTFRGYSSES